nr:SDR family oxidoreductase [Actinomadura rayongensis]
MIAVVTGAAGGLGAALCRVLAARGYEVTGVDVVPGAAEILDVTDPAACRDLAERLRPRVWINNAGVLAAGDVLGQPDADVRRCVEVNLLGVINGSRAAARVMAEDGRGHILNIGSLASWVPVPGESVYAATKHGVRAFTLGLAAELKTSNVKVSLLCPDGIWTPMLHDRLRDGHAALSFTGRRLLDAPRVASAALDLLDSGALVASVPRTRGAQVRALGAVPELWLALTPLLNRIGAFNQRRLARTRR